jgi:transcriptional regulator with XRE-family HTH domain
MSDDEREIPDWIEFARQSFENDLARLMAKKDLKRKDLAARMRVSPAHITQTLGRRNNYQLSSLVKLARGVGAVLEIRLADENSEVVRVVDIPTARFVDSRLEQLARLAAASPQDAGDLLAWREKYVPSQLTEAPDGTELETCTGG